MTDEILTHSIHPQPVEVEDIETKGKDEGENREIQMSPHSLRKKTQQNVLTPGLEEKSKLGVHLLKQLRSSLHYGDLEKVWQQGRFLEHPTIQRLLRFIEGIYGLNPNHPYMEHHLKQECFWFNDDQLLRKRYFNTTGFTETDHHLSWYYIPHHCQTYVIFIWYYLTIATTRKYAIVQYPFHCVCVDEETNQIYDLNYYLYQSMISSQKYQQHVRSNLLRGYVIPSDQVPLTVESFEYQLPLYHLPTEIISHSSDQKKTEPKDPRVGQYQIVNGYLRWMKHNSSDQTTTHTPVKQVGDDS